MKKIAIIALSIVIVALVAGYLVVNKDRGSDRDQIVAAMERARQAIEKESASEVAACISQDYSDDYSNNHQKIVALSTSAFAAKCDYEAVVSAPEVTVNGNEAEAKAHLQISSIAEGDKQAQLSTDVVLRFAKEPSRRFLIFRTSEWRITKIDGIDKVMETGF